MVIDKYDPFSKFQISNFGTCFTYFDEIFQEKVNSSFLHAIKRASYQACFIFQPQPQLHPSHYYHYFVCTENTYTIHLQ